MEEQYIDKFLDTMDEEQLDSLKFILEDLIGGDIDYFIYKINKRL